jgi:hypothetical protein
MEKLSFEIVKNDNKKQIKELIKEGKLDINELMNVKGGTKPPTGGCAMQMCINGPSAE